MSTTLPRTASRRADLPIPGSPRITTRRPRPPPTTGRLPLPLTANSCTETPSRSPSPVILKLPPPWLAKFRQSNDQTSRHLPGATNGLPWCTSLPDFCHSTPSGALAVVRDGGLVSGRVGSGPFPSVVTGAALVTTAVRTRRNRSSRSTGAIWS